MGKGGVSYGICLCVFRPVITHILRYLTELLVGPLGASGSADKFKMLRPLYFDGLITLAIAALQCHRQHLHGCMAREGTCIGRITGQ